MRFYWLICASSTGPIRWLSKDGELPYIEYAAGGYDFKDRPEVPEWLRPHVQNTFLYAFNEEKDAAIFVSFDYKLTLDLWKDVPGAGLMSLKDICNGPNGEILSDLLAFKLLR